MKERKAEGDEKVKDRGEDDELKGPVNEEAKNILKELKEQQQEQKLLIEEQKQIIQDLKQHQKEAHQVIVHYLMMLSLLTYMFKPYV